MGTKPGTVTDWLSSEFAGCGEDVGGSPRRLLVALSGGHLGGGGWQGSFFPSLPIFWEVREGIPVLRRRGDGEELGKDSPALWSHALQRA